MATIVTYAHAHTTRRATRLALAAALLVVALGDVAHANNDRIVLEAYDGERPADATTILAPVFAELGRRGFLSGQPLAAAIDARISHAAGDLTTSEMISAQRDVEDGYQLLVEGDYVRSLAKARAALATYDGAPGKLAREPLLRDLRYKALIVAARSLEVNGDAAAAFSVMAEVIRAFPDRPVTTAQFDPRVGALYRRVKAELMRQGPGSLEVRVDDPGVTIFVDEQFAGSGGAKLGPIAPGRYRVHLAMGQTPGRVHEVEVAPGGAATLNLEWSMDSALDSSGTGVALRVPRSELDESGVPAASQLARALGAHTVIVLGIRRINGRRTITGYSVSVESQTRTFAGVQIEPLTPSSERLVQLATLLAGDKAVESDGLITTEPEPEGAAPRPRIFTTKRKVAVAVGAVGLASIAAGVTFGVQAASSEGDAAAICPNDACDRAAEANAILSRGQTRATYANVAYGVGGAALAAATILWLTGGSTASSERLVVSTHVSREYTGISISKGF